MAIYIIGKLKQKNDGKFALLDAADVEMPDGTRLSEKTFVRKTSELENDSQFLTSEDLNGLAEGFVELLNDKVSREELGGEVIEILNNHLEPITQEEYDALVAADAIESKPYFIKKETT